MRLEEVKKKVEDMQKKHMSMTKLSPIGEVFEPGTTGFKPKKGMVLVNALEIKHRERVFQVESTQLTTDDFHGVHPRLGLVMESACDDFKPGDVILLGNQIRANDIVIDGTVGALVYESDILGIDKNM